MKRHKSTIRRELQRNRGERGYRPAQAHQQSAVRRRADNGKRISEHTWALVDVKLGQQWSPEQICGYLKVNGMPSVSHERIYQHIYSDKRAGGALHKSLRCQKQRKKRYDLSAHNVAGIEEAIDSARARLIYLLPYSPELSPIENCWSKLKTSLRKAKARTRDALDAALKEAINCITANETKGWFDHCGYRLH